MRPYKLNDEAVFLILVEPSREKAWGQTPRQAHAECEECHSLGE